MKELDLLNEGVTRLQAGEIPSALRFFNTILVNNPQHFDALQLTGVCYLNSRRYREAVEFFDAAIKQNRRSPVVYANRGIALKNLGLFDKAVESYQDAINLQPRNPDALYNLGLLYTEISDIRTAKSYYLKALSIKADYPEAHNNLANILKIEGKYQDALQSYELAIEMSAGYIDAKFNYAALLQMLGFLDRALDIYDDILLAAPDHTQVKFNKSLLLLLTADFSAGLPLYEARLDLRTECLRNDIDSLRHDYQSENIEGKSILIRKEQGLGDLIHFCRYGPILANRGAIVTIEAPQCLSALISTLDSRINVVIDPIPSEYDYQVFVMSLPIVCDHSLCEIPNQVPYLTVPVSSKARWEHKIPTSKSRKIGVVWSGSDEHENDQNRSIQLAEFSSILLEGFEWHCLQVEFRERDRSALEELPNLILHGHELADFSDTGGLIERLDLVVTVDTSVAHLAGALAIPFWLLLPKVPDFRWFLDRDDSPWYPTGKLYRQTQAGDWGTVLRQVALDLENIENAEI